jgi:hypothetical protein
VAFFQAVKAVQRRPHPATEVGGGIELAIRHSCRGDRISDVVDIFAAAGLNKPDISPV